MSEADLPAATAETVAEPTATPEPVETAEPTPQAEPTPEAEPTPAADSTAETPEPDPVESMTEVVLLDPGAEPRVELRMSIAADCGEVMTLTQVQEIAQTLDEEPMPGGGRFGNVMVMTTAASPNGDNFDVRSEITSANATPDTAPAVATAINAQLEDLIGMVTTVTMTDQNQQVPGSVVIEGAEALGPMQGTVEALTQAQAPLPDEAVGVGARWQTISTINLQGLALTTDVETTIVSIEGTVVEFEISGTQHVELGSTMNMAGISAEVVEWNSITTGTGTIDLTTISPISSTAFTEATQVFDMGALGGLLAQDITSEISVSTEPNDAC